MQHAHYPHKIMAVYPDAATAAEAVASVKGSRPGDIEVQQLSPGDSDIDLAIEPEPEAARDTTARDTLAGGTAGALAGGAASGASAIIAPSLFMAAPVAGPLIVMGYGAMLGSFAGAIRGVRPQEGELAALAKDALKAGNHVVLIHAADDTARQKVEGVINATLPEETAQA